MALLTPHVESSSSGYMSPVSSAYKKEGLVAAHARVEMCSLATQGHQWLSVDNFEALNPEYVPTAQCLDHFNHELELLGGIETDDGEKKHIRVALLVILRFFQQILMLC